mmetsp:Transcript_16926/g.18892  ORF Transcript_16926/g.18892 Transcript_16926/m.18892 type:complete len:230 (-) Transcript_16926:294-983(-)
MNAHRREVAFIQEFVELLAPPHAVDEDHDLVELEGIEQVVELPVFLGLLQAHVILLQAVQGELGLIVDEDFERVLGELGTHWADLLGKSGREHHHLLLVGRLAEDGLHIAAHIQRLRAEHLVTLIQNESLQVLEIQVALTHQLQDTTRCANDNVRRVVRQDGAVFGDRNATEEHLGLHVRQILREPHELLADLIGQFARVAQDEGVHLSVNRSQLLQDCEDENCRLAHA